MPAGIRRGGNRAGICGVSISAGKRGRRKWPQDLCDGMHACVCEVKGTPFLVVQGAADKQRWVGRRKDPGAPQALHLEWCAFVLRCEPSSLTQPRGGLEGGRGEAARCMRFLFFFIFAASGAGEDACISPSRGR